MNGAILREQENTEQTQITEETEKTKGISVCSIFSSSARQNDFAKALLNLTNIASPTELKSRMM